MNTALIFAGGVGQRMNSKSVPKQFLELHGKAIIIYTIEHFEQHPEIDGIVVVCLDSWIPHLQKLLARFAIQKVKRIVPGGETGQGSIRNGLNALQEIYPPDSLVLIHDGVRPLINEDVITKNIACAKEKGNAVTVVPASETIVMKGAAGTEQTIGEIVDRSQCMIARAPQTYGLGELIDLHERSEAENLFNFIDSACMMSHFGRKLHAVEGPVENIKITTPGDYYVFRALMDMKENSQIIFG